jgi:hypothetical protein
VIKQHRNILAPMNMFTHSPSISYEKRGKPRGMYPQVITGMNPRASPGVHTSDYCHSLAASQQAITYGGLDVFQDGMIVLDTN